VAHAERTNPDTNIKQSRATASSVLFDRSTVVMRFMLALYALRAKGIHAPLCLLGNRLAVNQHRLLVD
jgi:hypothetical protein